MLIFDSVIFERKKMSLFSPYFWAYFIYNYSFTKVSPFVRLLLDEIITLLSSISYVYVHVGWQFTYSTSPFNIDGVHFSLRIIILSLDIYHLPFAVEPLPRTLPAFASASPDEFNINSL